MVRGFSIELNLALHRFKFKFNVFVAQLIVLYSIHRQLKE